MKQADVLQLTGVTKNQYTSEHAGKMAAIFNFFKELGNDITSVTTVPVVVMFGKRCDGDKKVINAGEKLDAQRITVNTRYGHYFVDVPCGKLYTEFCKLLNLETAQEPTGKVLQSFTFTPDVLAKLKTAVNFISKDNLRPVLQAVCVEIIEHKLQVISTNCHQLYISELIDVDGPAGEYTFLIPGAAIKKLPKFKADTIVFDVLEESKVSIGGNIIELFTDGRFVDWRCVVPEYKNKLVFDRELFIQKLNEVMPYTNRTISEIKIVVKNDIYMHGQDVDFSLQCSAVMPYQEKTLTQFAIAFNGKMLLTTLKSYDCKTITLLSDGQPQKAGLFTDGIDTILNMPLLLLGGEDFNWQEYDRIRADNSPILPAQSSPAQPQPAPEKPAKIERETAQKQPKPAAKLPKVQAAPQPAKNSPKNEPQPIKTVPEFVPNTRAGKIIGRYLAFLCSNYTDVFIYHFSDGLKFRFAKFENQQIKKGERMIKTSTTVTPDALPEILQVASQLGKKIISKAA